MAKIAVFPGTFDPITKGHEELVKRALPLFDHIIIAVGTNSAKQHMFDIEKRMNWIKNVFKNESRVSVESYQGLTVDFCQAKKAPFILRGLRSVNDFEYEKSISQMNLALNPEVETVFIITSPEYSAISSTIVRDIIKYGGNASKFLPEAVQIN